VVEKQVDTRKVRKKSTTAGHAGRGRGRANLEREDYRSQVRGRSFEGASEFV